MKELRAKIRTILFTFFVAMIDSTTRSLTMIGIGTRSFSFVTSPLLLVVTVCLLNLSFPLVCLAFSPHDLDSVFDDIVLNHPQRTDVDSASQQIYIAPDGDDNATGTKEDPVRSFQRALEIGDEIYADSGVDISLNVMEGIYHAENNSNLIYNHTLYISVDEPNSNKTVTVNVEGEYHFLTIYNGNSNATLSITGLTIINSGLSAIVARDVAVSIDSCNFISNGIHSDGPPAAGGAVQLTSSEPISDYVFQNCSFRNNTATFGGAVSVNSTVVGIEKQAASFFSCTFINNTALLNGGAVFLYGANTRFAVMNLANNTAVGGRGGGVFASADGNEPQEATLIISDGFLLQNNMAQTDGGGMYIFNTSLSGTGDITMIGNQAISGYGGAAYVSPFLNLDNVDGLNVTANTARLGGGGICVDNKKAMRSLNNATFLLNDSVLGGSQLHILGGALTSNNSTFTPVEGQGGVMDREIYVYNGTFDMAVGGQGDLYLPSFSMQTGSLLVLNTSEVPEENTQLVVDDAFEMMDNTTLELTLGTIFTSSSDFYWYGGTIRGGTLSVGLHLELDGKVQISNAPMDLPTKHFVQQIPVTSKSKKFLFDDGQQFSSTSTLEFLDGSQVEIRANVAIECTNFMSTSNISLRSMRITVHSPGSVVFTAANLLSLEAFGSTNSANAPLVIVGTACLGGYLDVKMNIERGKKYYLIRYDELSSGPDCQFLSTVIYDLSSQVVSGAVFEYEEEALTVIVGHEKEGLGSGIIIGIILTCLTLLVLVTVVAYYKWFNRKQQYRDDQLVNPFERVSGP